MRINAKLVALFTTIIVATIGSLGFMAYTTIESTVVDARIQDMKQVVIEKSNQIDNLHDRASEDIVFAVKNPRFAEYFELDDTRNGNVYDDNNVLQYTSSQIEIKSKLEVILSCSSVTCSPINASLNPSWSAKIIVSWSSFNNFL